MLSLRSAVTLAYCPIISFIAAIPAIDRGSGPGQRRPRRAAVAAGDVDRQKWNPKRMGVVTRKLCWEIFCTLSPFKARKYVRSSPESDKPRPLLSAGACLRVRPSRCIRYIARCNDMADFASLFCIAVWLSPVIPDHSEVRAARFSNGSQQLA